MNPQICTSTVLPVDAAPPPPPEPPVTTAEEDVDVGVNGDVFSGLDNTASRLACDCTELA